MTTNVCNQGSQNQTILGLKSVNNLDRISAAVCQNQTILGLKYIKNGDDI